MISGRYKIGIQPSYKLHGRELVLLVADDGGIFLIGDLGSSIRATAGIDFDYRADHPTFRANIIRVNLQKRNYRNLEYRDRSPQESL